MNTKVVITVPFEDAEKMAGVWSEEENEINFYEEPQRAARCTICFAAMELKKYLSKILLNSEISLAGSAKRGDITIHLEAKSLTENGETFEWCPEENGLVIRGNGRTGVLYGAYAFLRKQGWRWIEPGKVGEICPPVRGDIELPGEYQKFSPALKNGRGFEFEGLLKESAALWLWMARNGLNLAADRPNTRPLLNKLGMYQKAGGHIFEKILDPERILPSGKTIWEEHPEWYGTPAQGEKTKERALKTQFCVSQPELVHFLSEEILRHLETDWKYADRIDIWGFDTWGGVCACEKCKKLGNGSDQILHFLSNIREKINQAQNNRKIEHPIHLVTTAYEGTSTLQPPLNPIPQTLLDAGDYVVFCPILRCYEHDLDDLSCRTNAVYWKALEEWCKTGIQVMMLEYYNVSKFEDLPLVFSDRIRNDLPAYNKIGVNGLTYMHLPMVNWGMRALNHTLYARLAWNPEENVDEIIQDYLTARYGEFAAPMKEVYRLIENAWSKCASWRSWSKHNVLQSLHAWNGTKPQVPLDAGDHFDSPEEIEYNGRSSIAMLERAMNIIIELQREYRRKIKIKGYEKSLPVIVNPVEQKRQDVAQVEYYLDEDKRLLVYGIDTMCLMTEMVTYYNALLCDDTEKAGMAWNKIEVLEEKMSQYYVPLGFDNPDAGLFSYDALTRTQLRDVIMRCRCNRL